MVSAICTLFEGHYHHGVAALANSLYYQGFKGEIYAGYRGALPQWTSKAEESTCPWPGSKTLEAKQDLIIHFLPLETDYHLTNYKPDFMLRLLDEVQPKADSLFYFDPDIVIVRPWSMFEDWVKCGVALSEDVNSPLAEHHPRRITWRRYFKEKGIPLEYKVALYVNGGFIGVTHEDKGFLEVWKCIQEAMAPIIGGLNRSTLSNDVLPQPFDRTDQDALNATVEAWNGIVSIIGQEAMAFKPGMPLLPHALGNPKPWKSNPLVQAVVGFPPRLVDHEYWNSSKGPIKSHPMIRIRNKLFALKIAAFIGRFYKRS